MNRAIEIFKELCAIPHGSGNMEGVSAYCADFGRSLGLAVYQDASNNVVIKKKGSGPLENAAPVILQGHMDMVCQKEPGVDFDFEKEGLRIRVSGDRMFAEGTSLGGDNGIAVALILALLEEDGFSHPPIEAVLTTDEEIGMIGATAFDASLLSGKRLVNLDAEDDSVTVSCAGGNDLVLHYPAPRTMQQGKAVKIGISGLKGGHSGMEIHKWRVNGATLLGRFLSLAAKHFPVSMVELKGGEKSNAIPFHAFAILRYEDPALIPWAEKALGELAQEVRGHEPDFAFTVEELGEGTWRCAATGDSRRIFDVLCTVPTGVINMSPSIPDLAETSLNLGILEDREDQVVMRFYLRSNVASALAGLNEKLLAYAALTGAETESDGHYPPWEYREDSPLREAYSEVYREATGREPKVIALHAGLECGIFGGKIPDLDCIAIGPDVFDVHTPKESLSLSSVEKIYGRLKALLSRLS